MPYRNITCNVVRTVTRQSAVRPRNRSVPSSGNRFFFFKRPDHLRKLLGLQWVPQAFKSGVKQPGRRANSTLQSSGEVQNEWGNTFVPTYAFIVYIGRTIFLYFSNRWAILS
jgi:hypothetical protein